MNVGKILRYIMREENISVAELCEKTGVSRTSISDYINDVVSPRFNTFRKIVNVFNYDIIMISSTGRAYRVIDISEGLKYIRTRDYQDFRTMSINSGITIQYLRKLVDGKYNPTIRTVDTILETSNYKLKLVKRKGEIK